MFSDTKAYATLHFTLEESVFFDITEFGSTKRYEVTGGEYIDFLDFTYSVRLKGYVLTKSGKRRALDQYPSAITIPNSTYERDENDVWVQNSTSALDFKDAIQEVASGMIRSALL